MTETSLSLNTLLAPAAIADEYGYSRVAVLDTDALPNGGFVTSWLADTDRDGMADAIALQKFNADGSPNGGLTMLAQVPALALNPSDTDDVPAVSVDPLANGGYAISYAVLAPRTYASRQLFGTSTGTLDFFTVGKPLNYTVQLPQDLTGIGYRLVGPGKDGAQLAVTVTSTLDDSGLVRLIISETQLAGFRDPASVHLQITGVPSGAPVYVSASLAATEYFSPATQLASEEAGTSYNATTVNGQAATSAIVYAPNGRAEAFDLNGLTPSGLAPVSYSFAVFANNSLIDALGLAYPSPTQPITVKAINGLTYIFPLNGPIIIQGPTILPDINGIIAVPEPLLAVLGDDAAGIVLLINNLAAGSTVQADVSFRAPTVIQEGIFAQTYDASGNLLTTSQVDATTTGIYSIDSYGDPVELRVDVDALPAGGFVTSWLADADADGVPDGIAVQRVKADGTLDGAAITLGGISSRAVDGAVDPLANGGFAVSYQARADDISAYATVVIAPNSTPATVYGFSAIGSPRSYYVNVPIPILGAMTFALSGRGPNGQAVTVPLTLELQGNGTIGKIDVPQSALAAFAPGAHLTLAIAGVPSGLPPGLPILIGAQLGETAVIDAANPLATQTAFVSTGIINPSLNLGYAIFYTPVGRVESFDINALTTVPGTSPAYRLLLTCTQEAQAALGLQSSSSVVRDGLTYQRSPSGSIQVSGASIVPDVNGVVQVPASLLALLGDDDAAIALLVLNIRSDLPAEATATYRSPTLIQEGLFNQIYDASGRLVSTVQVDTATADLADFSNGYPIEVNIDVDALAGSGFVTSWLTDTDGDGAPDALAVQAFRTDGTPNGAPVILDDIPQAAMPDPDSEGPVSLSVDPLRNGGYAVSYQAQAPETYFSAQFTGTPTTAAGGVIDLWSVGKPRAYEFYSSGSLADVTFSLVGADRSGNMLTVPLSAQLLAGGSGWIVLDEAVLGQFANPARVHLQVVGLPNQVQLIVNERLAQIQSYDTALPLVTAPALVNYVQVPVAAGLTIGLAAVGSGVGRVEGFDLNGLTPKAGMSPSFRINVVGNNELIGRLGLQMPAPGQLVTSTTIDGLSYQVQYTGLIVISGAGLVPDINGIIQVPPAVLAALGTTDAQLYLIIQNLEPGTTVEADIMYRPATIAQEGFFTQVYDAAGNVLAAPAIDLVSPQLYGLSPRDDATAVALDDTIVVTFTEAIARGTGAIALRTGSATGPVVESFDAATSSRIAVSGASLSIDPTNPLDSSTRYFITLESGSIKDLAGNPLLGLFGYDFTTIDLTPPTVTAITYGQNDGVLALGEEVSLTIALSEAVRVVGTPTIALANGGTASYVSGSGTGTLTFSYTPGAGQETGDLATAASNALDGVIADLAGNGVVMAGFDGVDPAGTLAVDATRPAISSSAPADGATGVAPGANIALTFSESIVRGQGTIVLRQGSADGAVVESFDMATSPRVAISGSTLTLDPTSDLAGGTRYFVVLPAGAVMDPAGNTSAEISTYDFVTADNTPPTVSAITYGQNDGALALGEAVTLGVAFSEAVIVSGTPTITLANGGTAAYTGGSGTGTLTFSYTPGAGQSASDLATAASNALGGTITDLAGNAVVASGFNGVNPAGTLAVDVAAPTVATFAPADGATSIAVGSNIALTFSEGVLRGTGTITLRSGSATGPVVESFDAATSSRVSLSGATLTIDPTSDLAAGTQYFVVLPSGAVRDAAGNVLTGVTTYDFTTAAPVSANRAPTITSNGGGATAAISLVENTVAVTTVKATDPDAGTTLTYAIAGGADAARFTINSATGALSFLAAPNFEVPTDDGANSIYNVVVQVSDGSLATTQALAITITNATEAVVGSPPTITSNGGGATAAITIVENTATVTTVIATDPDAGTALNYFISGGADAALFRINPVTGALSFITTPDFDTRADAGANNVYDVIVRASDGVNTDSQAIAVTLTNTRGVTITGTAGNDTITPAATVSGQPYPTNEEDSIQGAAGNDTLGGDGGNDTLVGGPGTDWIDGGEGSDLYLVALTADHPAAEFADSGVAGTDEVRFTGTTAGSTLTLYAGDTGLERAVIGTGTAAAAVTTGTAALNINAVALGYGITLVGNSGANGLTGGEGNDTLVGGPGLDRLDGGAGSDVYIIATSGDHSGAEFADTGASGIDEVRFTSATANSTLTLFANDTGIERVVIGTGTTGAAVTTATTALNINAYALGYGVALAGNSGANVLTGGAGNDSLTGGGGVDTFRVLAGTDTITDLGAGGADVLQVGVGATVNAYVTTAWTASAVTLNQGTASIATSGLAVNLAAAGVRPATKIGGEVLVNTQTTGNQAWPTVTSLAGGGFVVAWEDASGTLGDASGVSVKAQLYDANGAKLGGEFLVNTQTSGNQAVYKVAGLVGGGFVVTWSDYSGTLGDANGTSIKAQVFSASGVKDGSEFLVNTQTTGNQSTPSVTGLAGGGFVIAWEDWDSSGDGSGHSVRARLFDASGNNIGSDFVVNSQGLNNQWEPYVASGPDGGFIVTWIDGTSWQSGSGTLGDSSGGSTKAQIFSASGAKVGAEFLVNTQTAGEQAVKSIATLSNGNFIIAWEDLSGTLGDASGTSLKAQIFSASGAKLGSEFLINTQTAGNQLNPDIAALPEGRFLITWQDSSATLGDASGTSIKAQVFLADGTKLGGEYLVNTQTTGNQYAPASAIGANGNLFTVWMDASGTLGDASGTSIKGQFYSYPLAMDGYAVTNSGAATTLTGSAFEDTLSGGNGNDTLVGGASSDILFGGLGNDSLTGGSGADVFVFNTAPNGTANRDTITDFVSGTDTLQFSKATFAGLADSAGPLGADAFWAAAGATTAHDATDRFVYNTATGALYYDADGIGGAAAVQVAQMSGAIRPSLAYTDFLLTL